MTRRQYIGLAVIALLIGGMLTVMNTVPRRVAAVDEATADSMAHAADSLRRKAHTRYRYDTVEVVLRVFDPNTADSMTLLQLGLRPWQVHNMLLYRARGGRWREAADMKRLYGMTDSLYRVLEPYISIAPPDTCGQDTAAVERAEKAQRDTVIDLNSADTAALCLIRGIGPYSAVRILRYRQELGGYVSPEQLRELADMPWDRAAEEDGRRPIPLDSILPHLTATADSVKPLAVNRLSAERLMRHPYLSFEQARDIYELRRERIRLRGPEDLRAVPSLTDSDRVRIAPYLSFERVEKGVLIR